VAILNHCDAKYGLGYNPLWVAQVGMYFRSLTGASDLGRGWHSKTATQEHICNSYDRNIMVNHYGVARLCFSGQFPGKTLQRSGDLKRFWLGSDNIRKLMRSCNQFCGISHSVKRESSTLDGRQKMLDHQADAAPMRPDLGIAGDLTWKIMAGMQAVARFTERPLP